ncbi:MAG TPA: hypothetical protein VFA52_04370 [Candidatus Paceibacterota bacterium]|jgi:hypothetical protein|nr:hypothetical protein [Candidatus Paceibacterota bacterium]
MSELMFTTRSGGNFEKPKTGMYNAVLADIVDLGEVTTVYNGQAKVQPMVRFVWILDAKGKDGRPLLVTARYSTNLHERSNLYKAVKQILNAPPPTVLNPESLIGLTRRLFIQTDVVMVGQEQREYANILGITPADPGVVVKVPSDFVRDRNKPVAEQAKNRRKTQNQAVNSASAPPVSSSQATPDVVF